MSPLDARATRRQFLLAGGATAVLVACGSTDEKASTTSTSSTATSTTGKTTTTGATASTLAAADFASLGTCKLMTEKTAGPFPLDEQFGRRDITEGYPGHPLRLGFRVVDQNCEPIDGAAVEVWHTDATGDYSAYTADGSGTLGLLNLGVDPTATSTGGSSGGPGGLPSRP